MYKCDICGYETENKQAYCGHRSSAHSQNRKGICPCAGWNKGKYKDPPTITYDLEYNIKLLRSLRFSIRECYSILYDKYKLSVGDIYYILEKLNLHSIGSHGGYRINSGLSDPYKYNDIIFDTKNELSVFIYYNDNGVKLTKCYSPIGNNYNLVPDFVDENGNYYEVKSDRGSLYGWEVDKYKSFDNLKIIIGDEIIKINNYIIDKYGDNYLDQFKFIKPNANDLYCDNNILKLK